VLVALDVRLHVLRRHQSNLVAKRAQLPRPVVRRRARLQANQTGRQSTEERQNLRTPKLLAQNRRSLCIDPVHLKNMLRQVQSDRSNLAHGWLPFAADSIRQQFGTQMPQGGHPPHHSITSSARASRVGGTATLASIVAKAHPGIRFNEHVEGDGPTVFAHACKLGLEGIVSKRKDSAYRSGRSPDWLKMKNPDAPAVTREAEEDWAR